MKYEQWQDIPGYGGYYQASDFGRVRSIDRVVTHTDGRHRKLLGRILPQHKHNSPIPYWAVNLHKGNNQKTHLVHRLVAITWLGPVPEGFEVCHGFDGYSENAVSNLSYGSRSDNEHDKIRDGTSRHKRVRRSDGAEFDSINEAAEATGCHASKITAVCKGRQHTTGGYSWAYR